MCLNRKNRDLCLSLTNAILILVELCTDIGFGTEPGIFGTTIVNAARNMQFVGLLNVLGYFISFYVSNYNYSSRYFMSQYLTMFDVEVKIKYNDPNFLFLLYYIKIIIVFKFLYL